MLLRIPSSPARSKPQQCYSFANTGISANQYYDTNMRDCLRDGQEVVPITSNQDIVMVRSEAKDLFIRCARIKQFPQPEDLMTHGGKAKGHIIRYIVIKKERHEESPGLIWRAMSKSISPR